MTVGLIIVSHSALLAAGVAELAGQMAHGKTPIVAAGGTNEDTLGTSVDKILAALQNVNGPDGALILLDLGSAVLSAEMALEMLDEAQRGRVRLSAAPLVEGAVAAALEASLGHTLAEVQQAAEKTAGREQLRKLKPITQEETTAPSRPPVQAARQAAPSPAAVRVAEEQLQIKHQAGLHARPASLFVQTAARFKAQVRVLKGGKEVSASSILGVLSLAVRQGDTITVRASGEEAEAAVSALRNLVQSNFQTSQ